MWAGRRLARRSPLEALSASGDQEEARTAGLRRQARGTSMACAIRGRYHRMARLVYRKEPQDQRVNALDRF